MDGVGRGSVAFFLSRLIFDQLFLLIFDSLNNRLQGERRLVRILITRRSRSSKPTVHLDLRVPQQCVQARDRCPPSSTRR